MICVCLLVKAFPLLYLREHNSWHPFSSLWVWRTLRFWTFTSLNTSNHTFILFMFIFRLANPNLWARCTPLPRIRNRGGTHPPLPLHRQYRVVGWTHRLHLPPHCLRERIEEVHSYQVWFTNVVRDRALEVKHMKFNFFLMSYQKDRILQITK